MERNQKLVVKISPEAAERLKKALKNGFLQEDKSVEPEDPELEEFLKDKPTAVDEE